MLHKYNVLFIGKTFLSNSIYKDLFLFLTDLYPNTNGVISLLFFQSEVLRVIKWNMSLPLDTTNWKIKII